MAQVASCTSENLLTNGGAEDGPINITGSATEPPTGWETTGNMRALAYGTANWPSADDPGPPDRGVALFVGGPSDPISTITQRINLTSRAAAIDAGLLTYALCGWLGGFDSQGDAATLSVTFEDQAGLELGVDAIGPVLREDREDTTALLERSTQGSVPSGTRTAVVVLLADRVGGVSNDGYADELRFTVAGGPSRATPGANSLDPAPQRLCAAQLVRRRYTRGAGHCPHRRFRRGNLDLGHSNAVVPFLQPHGIGLLELAADTSVP